MELLLLLVGLNIGLSVALLGVVVATSSSRN